MSDATVKRTVLALCLASGPITTMALAHHGITSSRRAQHLSRLRLGRSVIDETGLAGYYRVHMKWTADQRGPGTLENTDASPARDDGSEPSIFTALREQTGTKVGRG